MASSTSFTGSLFWFLYNALTFFFIFFACFCIFYPIFEMCCIFCPVIKIFVMWILDYKWQKYWVIANSIAILILLKLVMINEFGIYLPFVAYFFPFWYMYNLRSFYICWQVNFFNLETVTCVAIHFLANNLYLLEWLQIKK